MGNILVRMGAVIGVLVCHAIRLSLCLPLDESGSRPADETAGRLPQRGEDRRDGSLDRKGRAVGPAGIQLFPGRTRR